MLRLPKQFVSVPYDGARYPGAPGVEDISQGANCQLFAFEVLRYFGLELPAFRSSELWDDQVYTVSVTVLEPLDLLLFNRALAPWGAHVGVYTGDDKVLHLSKRVGWPVVWQLSAFAAYPEYHYLVGAKRTISNALKA